MSSTDARRSRLVSALLTLSAAAALGAALAAPAGAAEGQGTATIATASHKKGRSLSAQGVKLLAGPGTAGQGNKLTLPIAELSPGARPAAASGAGLNFKRGKRSVALDRIRFDLGAGTLTGSLGGEEIAVFRLGGTPTAADGGNAVSLQAGKLELTGAAASALKQKLGLQQAPARSGVGMIWLDAHTVPAAGASTPPPAASEPAAKEDSKPPYAAPLALTGGGFDWGVLASWRSYILGNFGPGSVGGIATADGATATGTLSEASSFFSFPGADGSYRKGLNGNADKLTLQTEGSVKFAKPGHCIVEVKLSDLELTIDGADSGIELDSIYDIDTPAGMSCTDQPAVPTADVDFATLDVSAVTPTYSDGGRTITWSAIPARLTAAGAAAFGAGYPADQELDPVTVSVEAE